MLLHEIKGTGLTMPAGNTGGKHCLSGEEWHQNLPETQATESLQHT